MIDFLLDQTCTIYPWSHEYDGEDVYGMAEERPCRVQEGAHLRHTYKNPAGVIDQIEARAKLFTKGDPIPVRSKVLVDGREYIVIDCEVKRGFKHMHLEAYMQ